MDSVYHDDHSLWQFTTNKGSNVSNIINPFDLRKIIFIGISRKIKIVDNEKKFVSLSVINLKTAKRKTQLENFPMNRRHFFEKFVSALFGGTALAFLTPALGFLFPNRHFGATGREFTDAAGQIVLAGSITEGDIRLGLLGGKPALVARRNGELIALSAVCTHLGCIVAFNAGANTFQCPCHGGKYDRDGNVIAGPPPQPLERLNIKVEDDKIILA